MKYKDLGKKEVTGVESIRMLRYLLVELPFLCLESI
ncbi:hypothetical protein AT05_01870 [Schleiferia thermophila str. Yellowstone]|nr:hypothetical protein AT05_01870 [Schleiferia thermophila str. Yellowstone]